MCAQCVVLLQAHGWILTRVSKPTPSVAIVGDHLKSVAPKGKGKVEERGSYTPPPPCISYALVQATVGVGTVLIWDLTLIRYQT